jgi:hypothetical protein
MGSAVKTTAKPQVAELVQSLTVNQRNALRLALYELDDLFYQLKMREQTHPKFENVVAYCPSCSTNFIKQLVARPPGERRKENRGPYDEK